MQHLDVLPEMIFCSFVGTLLLVSSSNLFLFDGIQYAPRLVVLFEVQLFCARWDFKDFIYFKTIINYLAK